MVYGSLSLISFLLFLKSYGVVAQCPGRLDLLPASNIPAYLQPVGQVCFPAVIQIPDNNPPQPSAPQDDDDDYLNLIYLLISALSGSSNGNSNSKQNFNSNGRNSVNPNTQTTNKNPGPNNGFFDIASLINGPIIPGPSPSPCSIFNPNPITISIDPNGASTGCACDACNYYNNPFASFNQPPGIINPWLDNALSTGPVPSYIPDIFSAGNGCIYVPYPVPVPYNIPGYNFDNIYYPECDNGPQEINLIIKTQCE